MDSKTKEVMRELSIYIANHYTMTHSEAKRRRQKWVSFIKKSYRTEINAKPAFNGLLGAFRFGELLLFVLFTVKPDVFCT